MSYIKNDDGTYYETISKDGRDYIIGDAINLSDLGSKIANLIVQKTDLESQCQVLADQISAIQDKINACNALN